MDQEHREGMESQLISQRPPRTKPAHFFGTEIKKVASEGLQTPGSFLGGQPPISRAGRAGATWPPGPCILRTPGESESGW